MATLEERMESAEEQQKLIDALNSVNLYTSLVKKCGYARIGVQVLSRGMEKFAYTSFNGPDGKITHVEKGLRQPDLTAKVEETVLAEILEKSETLMENPVLAALQYGLKFKLPWRAYYKLIKHFKNL